MSIVYDKHCTWPIIRNLRGGKQTQACIKDELDHWSLRSPRQDAAICPFRSRLSGKVIAWADPEVKFTEILCSSSWPCCPETEYVGGGKKSLSKIYNSSKDPRTYILAPKASKIFSVRNTQM